MATKIVKASGEIVDFDPSRLRESLRRAGADPLLVKKITDRMESHLHEGMTTKEIYRKAFNYLKKWERPSAARYSLKRAILALGPAGYPFENFMARLLEEDGYDVKVGVILKGHCIDHELDLYASDASGVIFGECKYHSGQHRKSDVQTALYFHSRFEDLEQNLAPEHRGKKCMGYLVTNTRFTLDADQYGTCVGLKMISWDSPRGDSLKERINRSGLHPITCMTTITRQEKEQLIGEGILLTQDLVNQFDILKKWSISEKRMTRILEEAEDLCHGWE